jgi:hypothetical protein
MRGPWLARTDSGGAAWAASPTVSRLSRYPTRTAPAAPGHLHTRARPPAAATNPPRWRARPTLPAHAPWQTVGELKPTIRLDPQSGRVWLLTRGSACGNPDVAAARIVGG